MNPILGEESLVKADQYGYAYAGSGRCGGLDRAECEEVADVRFHVSSMPIPTPIGLVEGRA